MNQYYDLGNYPTTPEVFNSFEAVNDALYVHERAYYYHAARGMVNSDFSPAWHRRRKELQDEWRRLCPPLPHRHITPKFGHRFMNRILMLFNR